MDELKAAGEGDKYADWYETTRRRSKDLILNKKYWKLPPEELKKLSGTDSKDNPVQSPPRDPQTEGQFAEWEASFAAQALRTHQLFNPGSKSPPRRRQTIGRCAVEYDKFDPEESRPSSQLVRRRSSTSGASPTRRNSLPTGMTGSTLSAVFDGDDDAFSTPEPRPSSKESVVRRAKMNMARARRASI
jgi:hypothetical protein